MGDPIFTLSLGHEKTAAMRGALLGTLLCVTIVSLAAPAIAGAAGDLGEIKKAGTIRFLIPSTPDYLPRASDPRTAEMQLAEDFAKKLGLKASFVPVEQRDRFLDELNAGHGDVVVASLSPTPERNEVAAFTRPIRFVRQVVVAAADESGVAKIDDLAGKELVVRASSSYASTLKLLADKFPGMNMKPAGEREDTFDLIQKVARKEIRLTVADSDIFEAARLIQPNIKKVAELTEKDPIAWAIRKKSTGLKAALDAFIVEKALTSHKEETYKSDLEEIKKRRVLRVLTRNASNCFFIYRGEQLGFEYELAQDFAKSLGVRLELIVAPSREALLEHLAEGRGDLVAAGMTITEDRKKQVAFTQPYLTVSELVIVPSKDKTTKSLADLRGKKISVRKSSSYYEHLLELQGQYGFEIELLPEETETEDILWMLGEGKLAATVADSSIVDIELTYSDYIRSIGPLGDPVQIAWAVRPDQPQLLAAANAFVKRIYKGMFYNMTVTKYFKNTKTMKAASGDARADREGGLSKYDTLVKKFAKQYELDWRLVTSQMYQESRFDPGAKSWVGALGLMQVMPKTAQELKFDDVVDPEQGIHAGVKLLARYSRMFEEPAVKEKDRIRFALAGYNCGPGHVFDARRLAADLKLDPDRWFGNVEKAMLLLSEPKYARVARYGYCRCSEPVKYVSEIQTRYDAYSKLVSLE